MSETLWLNPPDGSGGRDRDGNLMVCCTAVGGSSSLAFPDRHLGCLDFEAEFGKLQGPVDAERVHVVADELLMDLVRWGDKIGELDEIDADALLALYKSVPKWYA